MSSLCGLVCSCRPERQQGREYHQQGCPLHIRLMTPQEWNALPELEKERLLAKRQQALDPNVKPPPLADWQWSDVAGRWLWRRVPP